MHAAGDAEDFRSDEAGFLGGEEDVQAGELHGLSGPLEGRFLPEFRQVLLQLASGHLQSRPDGAGSYHVHPDALGGYLLGQGAAEGDDGRFRGGIVHQVLAGW